MEDMKKPLNGSRKKGISSCALHLFAMAAMTMDHLFVTLLPRCRWLTVVGRLAFPIFAFLVVEGYFHTRSVKKYMGRMLLFALISEVPFDLMLAGSVFDPGHQNVLWTLLLALLLIHWMENARRREEPWILPAVTGLSCVLAYVVGFALKVDYSGPGILMVLVFYFFRGSEWWCYAIQTVLLYFLNRELGAAGVNLTLFGHTLAVAEQCAATLALIPIWLYRGRQGYHAKWLQYACYGFYPAHMIILYALQRLGA